MLVIRTEQKGDYKQVCQLIKKAFKTAKYSDGTEQDLVEKLRRSQSFIPELSLGATIDNKIVGHILFTKARINQVEVLTLAPLSVLPGYQHQGIGLSLIKHGHKIAQNLGYNYSVVLGDSAYYSKAGYIPASQYGIISPFEVTNENFMAICFDNNPQQLNGVIKYDDAFEIA